MPAITGTREAAQVPTDITTRALTLRAATVDEKARTVEAVLSTEAPATVFDFRSYEFIDEVLRADGMEAGSQVPMLESHNRWTLDAVLGSVRSITREGDKIVGRLHFAEGDERSDKAFNKVRQGHITDVSVGYRSTDYIDIKPNTTQSIKGRSYTAGNRTLRVTTKWSLREASLVPIGADEFAKIRENAGCVARTTRTEDVSMNEQLRKYLESIGLRVDADDTEARAYFDGLDGEQKREAERLKGGGSTTEKPTAESGGQRSESGGSTGTVTTSESTTTRASVTTGTVDVDAVRNAAAVEERRRISAIRELARDDVPDDVVQRAIDEGMNADQASRLFLTEVRNARSAPVSGHGPGIHSRDHQRDCTREAITAALVMRSEVSYIDKHATEERKREQARIAEAGERFADLSLLDVCREAIRLDGGTAPHGRDETIRVAVSGGALADIFSSTVGKVLLSTYAESPDTTGPLTIERDVADFKTVERHQMGKGAGLEKLPRGGTAKDMTLDSRMEQYKIARYAKKASIDEQDIIDDDMNALVQFPEEAGRAAARLRPDLVYSIIMGTPTMGDGVALFNAATHVNLNTSSALTATTLKAAITALATQQYDGVNLNLPPANILVPQALRFTAKELIRATQIILAGSTDANLPNFNSLSDEDLGIISDSRLDNGVTDPATDTAISGSATTWYLATRSGRHMIEVGFRRGTGRRPVMRSYRLDKGQWGIGFDINMDIGAKALDWRGFQKNTA